MSYLAVRNTEVKVQQEEIARSLPFYPATDPLDVMLKELFGFSGLPKHIYKQYVTSSNQ